jgi:hypothetical protein
MWCLYVEECKKLDQVYVKQVKYREVFVTVITIPSSNIKRINVPCVNAITGLRKQVMSTKVQAKEAKEKDRKKSQEDAKYYV